VHIPPGEHRLQSAYCLWYSRKGSGKQQHQARISNFVQVFIFILFFIFFYLINYCVISYETVPVKCKLVQVNLFFAVRVHKCANSKSFRLKVIIQLYKTFIVNFGSLQSKTNLATSLGFFLFDFSYFNIV
jgi:hypothetical protein